MRRRGLQIGLAILLVCVVSFSGLIAQQAWSESQARGQYDSARSALRAALVRAQTIGLYPAEIKPYADARRTLDSGAAPATSPFWRSQSTDFYRSQAAEFRRVLRQLHAGEKRITRLARRDAGSAVASLRSTISEGAAFGVEVSSSRTLADREAAALSTAVASGATPRKYRAISAAVQPALAALAASVQARKARISALAASARNSASGVISIASGELSRSDQTLSLLSLLTPRGAQYRTKLGQLMANVRREPDVTQAAVAEAALHDEIVLMQADAARTVPAKMIVVSTETQWAHVYQGGKDIYSTPVTTGGPELPTDHGVFHIYMKVSPFTFHSPWPVGSPYYYPPTPVQYWMPFYEAEGLHDASWRSNFGPGSNFAPTDLGTGNYILGTHGCVNLPTPAAAFIWNWAPVGTTVVVT